MMNYTAEEVKHEQTIGSDISETARIMREMKCALDDFASIVNGSKFDDQTPVDANCLWDEARMMTKQAYENLQKLIEIKGSII